MKIDQLMRKESKLNRRQFLKKTLTISAASSFSFAYLKPIFSQTPSANSAKIISEFILPYGIALGSNKRVYVSDAAGYCIKIFDSQGKLLKTIGKPGSKKGEFNFPQGLGIDENDHLFVMDSNNGRVSIFDAEGNYLSSFGKIGGYPEAFYTPKGIFVKDKIYICNTRNHFLAVYDKNSFDLLAKYGDLGDDPRDLPVGSLDYHFRLPTSVVSSTNGKIYVVDSKHGQVKVLDAEGKFLFKFGELGSNEGQFSSPEGIAIDAEQNIYVCDTLNSRIQKFNADGKFIAAMKKGLQKPTSLQIDADNLFYIVDAELKQVILTRWTT